MRVQRKRQVTVERDTPTVILHMTKVIPMGINVDGVRRFEAWFNESTQTFRLRDVTVALPLGRVVAESTSLRGALRRALENFHREES